MNYKNIPLINSLLLIVLLCFFAGNSLGASAKQDKTGTNPVNFTYDLKIYNEFSWLNPDGEQNVTTLVAKAPFADDKWQLQVKLRYSSLDVGPVDDSGFGDIDVRLLTVPYLNMEAKKAVAIGIEAFFDTASEDSLGSGATSLGPQVFMVFFNPFGINGLFAPAYQHKFSIDEDSGRDEIHQGAIDLNLLIMSESKLFWFFADPQIILDYEQDKEYSIVDLEVGAMLDKYLGTSGHSAYLRPSFGVGSDRPTDGSVEIGYKVVF
ncbi:MAG: hypothetical protein QNK27_08485 [Desulfuromusa sp.]|nr:hypothetical protein [Desulfuromusa sp.]